VDQNGEGGREKGMNGVAAIGGRPTLALAGSTTTTPTTPTTTSALAAAVTPTSTSLSLPARSTPGHRGRLLKNQVVSPFIPLRQTPNPMRRTRSSTAKAVVESRASLCLK
jgi:hypothetical protein